MRRGKADNFPYNLPKCFPKDVCPSSQSILPVCTYASFVKPVAAAAIPVCTCTLSMLPVCSCTLVWQAAYVMAQFHHTLRLSTAHPLCTFSSDPRFFSLCDQPHRSTSSHHLIPYLCINSDT